jgi:hypothetical protein
MLKIYYKGWIVLDIELAGLTDIFLEKICEISLTRISFSAPFRAGCRLPEKSHLAEEYNKVLYGLVSTIHDKTMKRTLN